MQQLITKNVKVSQRLRRAHLPCIKYTIGHFLREGTRWIIKRFCFGVGKHRTEEFK